MPFNSYQQAIDFLYAHLPIFQRVGARAYKPDLGNTLRLCEYLGNPHQKFKSIHVAGTNGKGSTSHMLASVLQSAGYNTGLYTSPHLKSFTERIRLNGVPVDEAFVVDFVNRIEVIVSNIQPSFFEVTVAMAFEFFASRKVDIAVVEVGLGGRLDSTNVITPELSVITNIGWDHKDLLGDTLQKIAFEKAGIIKPNVPVVISERRQEVDQVFVSKAAECGSSITFAPDVVHVERNDMTGGFNVLKGNDLLYADLKPDLAGFYQRKNLGGVIVAIETLKGLGYPISENHVRQGLTNVVRQTGLKGRWQKLHDRPMVVCDTGHNEDGIREVLQQISAQRFKRLYVVFGVVKDKDIGGVISLLPKDAYYYFCQAKIPRALDASSLKEIAEGFGLRGEVVSDVNAAYKKALSTADKDDFIFIGGSTFVVAEIEDL